MNGSPDGTLRDLDGAGITRYTWTPTGLQLPQTDPTGARIEATYDELGRQLTATTIDRYPSLRNLTTRFACDDAGNQLSSTTPGNHTTSATYNTAGDIGTITDPMGGVTRLRYDGLGRQHEITDPTGRRSTTSYDAFGNVLGQTDFGTGTTALRSLSAEFDADGNRTSATAADGARTTYTYDTLGRLTRQVEPVSAGKSITTGFGHDAAGNQTRLTDGRGKDTVYTFTPWNQPESTIEPATNDHPAPADRTWTTVYDAAGRSVSESLPGGVRRTQTYDGLGRMTAETGAGAEAATVNRTLEYDLAGCLTAAGTDGLLGRDTYTYNDRGQLLTAAGPGGKSSYAYDTEGNMTSRTNADVTTEYGYDAAGRLDWTWDEITGNDIWYGFDAAGRPTTERYAEQKAGSTTWQESARRTYGYDSLGRLTSDRITNPAGTTETASTRYEYDVDDRLTKKSTKGTAGAADHTYGYDLAGRMTSWTTGATTTEYGWDDAGNRVKAGSATSTYDTRNRLLTDGTSTYSYSARGTVASVKSPGKETRSLTFDAFERKITDGGTTYTYDSLDRVRGNGKASFSYDGGSNNLADDGTSRYTRTPDGSLLAVGTGTTKQWAVTDQHTDLTATLVAPLCAGDGEHGCAERHTA
ncbi:hypothetical protein [Streptomyces sp. NPDC093109]|uniref:hypothetical protein n=1 Tax=Streptomyces sp. NPDC093109 TaxID=3154977 RepID=UPI00344CDB78